LRETQKAVGRKKLVAEILVFLRLDRKKMCQIDQYDRKKVNANALALNQVPLTRLLNG
jgi:hypothetical protein